MSTAQERLAQLEAAYARIPPSQRLAMVAELLEWTVANFATPIADDTVRDLVARASAAVRSAANARLSAVPADRALLEQFRTATEDDQEPGAVDLLGAFRLCFDHLAPEITPPRVLAIFDRCYQADYVRYSEPEIAVGEDDASDRGQRILEYQAALLQRYLE
ncbi:hypothetical protein [Glycomyces arizonensis]|uniref:hypothetical protein n=1 Tax=Glycomyces arizonensis TaxID=256035 RepID=UPI00041CD13E|nr:hypothetical protein [Glycomyces arizonensis]